MRLMAKKINPTAKLLFESENRTLYSLVDKICYLEGVTQVLQTILEKPLSEHCRVANIRNGCVIIETDSSTWATLLRYQFPNILQKLRLTSGLEGIRSIDYYISPTEIANKKSERKNQLNISKHSANLLRDTAKGIKHQGLRDTLMKLAGHTET